MSWTCDHTSMISNQGAEVFRRGLYEWHQDIDRKMPWKDTKDAYKIWISEVILQQTRVAQGIKYYDRFIERFPDVKALAQGPEDDVLALWKGLGYYTRARNLYKAARLIMRDHNGVFPQNHADIIALPGIGPYAAAAIASFAYDQPYAVLDGNVYRVLSRYGGIETPIDTTEGKKTFSSLSQMLLDQQNPSTYNQAIMDFGALICKPSVPRCMDCTLRDSCRGYHDGLVDLLPIKAKKVKVKKRYFHYLTLLTDGGIHLEKREEKDIWKGLYQLPMIEGEKRLSKKEVEAKTKDRYGSFQKMTKVYSATQQLTHRLIYADFYLVEGVKKLDQKKATSFDKVKDLGLPKIIDDYFKDHLLLY